MQGLVENIFVWNVLDKVIFYGNIFPMQREVVRFTIDQKMNYGEHISSVALYPCGL